MAEVKGYVCDMCSNWPATRYIIRSRGVPEWSVDLCADCGSPIDGWHKKARPPAPKQQRRKAAKTVLPKQHSH